MILIVSENEQYFYVTLRTCEKECADAIGHDKLAISIPAAEFN